MATVKAKVVEVVDGPKMPTVWVVAYMSIPFGNKPSPWVTTAIPSSEEAVRFATSLAKTGGSVGNIRIIEIPGEA
jgi:hypothetical protein